MFRLDYGDGEDPRTMMFLVGEVWIGRARNCEVLLQDLTVSRNHARIIVDEDGVRIQDLESKHGTQVNGVPTAEAPLKNGDRILIGKASLQFSSLPTNPKSLETYLKAVRALPPPTEGQIAGFADYVGGAHSWYKHIPPVPPGASFYLFLNPSVAAGRSKDGFHYSDWSTDRYRKHCGYLDYRCFESSVPSVRLITREPTVGELNAFEEEDRAARAFPFPAPEEVLRAGHVKLTGLIHRAARQPMVMESFIALAAALQWLPSGGEREALAKILETARARYGLPDNSIQTAPPARQGELESELKTLLRAESNRQRALMQAATRRVLRLVYG